MSLSHIAEFVEETIKNKGTKKKHEKYGNVKLRLTPFWSRDTHEPDFFTPFQSFEDVRQEIRAPFYAFFICMGRMLNSTWSCVGYSITAVLNFAMLDFDRSLGGLRSFAENFIEAGYFLLNAIVDTIQATLSLISRSLVSLGYGGVVAFQLIKSSIGAKKSTTSVKDTDGDPNATVGAALRM